MVQRRPLTVAERETIYTGKLNGQRLANLAEMLSCSIACARKWWRVGRDSGLSGLHRGRQQRSKSGALSQFDPRVAERAVYWKQCHPKRGPTRILVDLTHDPQLRGVVLPKRTVLADFFSQTCPELLQPRHPPPVRPPPAHQVHERWQLDGKEAVRLADGTIATVFEVREPVGCVCLGAIAHAVQTAKAWRKLTLAEVQADLRQVFTEFGLPAGLQTDREKVYGRPPTEAFPSLFTLWLAGLGVQHHFGRPGQATDQPCIEREHRTLFDWLAQPQPWTDLPTLQAALDEARRMHNQVLPSTAGDCQGRPPLQAIPRCGSPCDRFIRLPSWRSSTWPGLTTFWLNSPGLTKSRPWVKSVSLNTVIRLVKPAPASKLMSALPGQTDTLFSVTAKPAKSSNVAPLRD